MIEIHEIDYQKQLILSGLDDFSPNAALSHVFGGQFGPHPEQWKQAVVDFLCINVRVGILKCVHRKEMSGENGSILLRRLLTFGDEDNHMDAEIVWNILYFDATSRFVDVLSEFNLNNWDALNQNLNPKFLEYLRRAYSAGCV